MSVKIAGAGLASASLLTDAETSEARALPPPPPPILRAARVVVTRFFGQLTGNLHSAYAKTRRCRNALYNDGQMIPVD